MPVQIARGNKAAVVSGDRIATETAQDVLQDGGNIVDAALAGAAILAVALPHACGLGGDCFILLHNDGKTHCLNGSGASPAKLPAGLDRAALATGPLSCAVPGMLGAWDDVHQRFGTRPWPRLLGPAIQLAREGVALAPDLAKALAANRQALSDDPGCQGLFVSESVVRDGALFQPALAATLTQIAEERSEALYGGDIGQRLCDASAARGGVLTIDDLRAYQPLWVEPLQCRYRGFDVRVAPPNSYGLLMLLQLAGLAGVSLGDNALDSAERLRLMMVATKAAIARGEPYLADPAWGVDAGEALSDAAVRALQEQVRNASAQPNALPPANGTAIISVADAEGNGVTVVQSIFVPFGSLVADCSTGIVLNNRLLGFSTQPGHINFAEAGKRPAHTLSPAMVFEDGRLRMLLGSPGGTGQTITLTQVLTNVVDYGVDLQSAVALPRWSLDIAGNMVAEAEIAAGTIATLNESGLAVRTATSQQRFFFGSAECIDISQGQLTAVADSRRDAYASAH